MQVRRAGHPPISGTFPTRTKAKTWATKIESDVNESHYGYSRVRTLAEAVDAFTNASSAAIKTLDDRNRHVAWWRREFGDRKLFHFTTDTVEQGRERLATENIEPNPKKPPRHRSPQTVRHYLMSLSACLEYARRRKKWIEKSPIADADMPPVAAGRIRWLSDDERTWLLAACAKSGNPDLALIVEIALASGARQAEILWLRWKQIDFDRECAFLPTSKTGEPRVMPLPGRIADALRERSKVCRINSPRVFGVGANAALALL